MEWGRESNNAEHRWVPDTKENRQIRAERMWERIRLTHWRPGPAQSTASARWRSCRTSNPEQRPSLPSRCVVWLSSDHPHAGYGNLREGEMGEIFLLAVAYSLSVRRYFFRPTSFTTLFQLMPWITLHLMVLWKKCMSVWTEDFQYVDFNQTKRFADDEAAYAQLSGNKGETCWTFWDKLDLASLITHSSLDSVQIKMPGLTVLLMLSITGNWRTATNHINLIPSTDHTELQKMAVVKPHPFLFVSPLLIFFSQHLMVCCQRIYIRLKSAFAFQKAIYQSH